MATNSKGPVVGRGLGGKAFYSEAKYHESAAYKETRGGRSNGPNPPRAGGGKLPTDNGGGGRNPLQPRGPVLKPGHPVYGSPVSAHPTTNGADTNAAVTPPGGVPTNTTGH